MGIYPYFVCVIISGSISGPCLGMSPGRTALQHPCLHPQMFTACSSIFTSGVLPKLATLQFVTSTPHWSLEHWLLQLQRPIDRCWSVIDSSRADFLCAKHNRSPPIRGQNGGQFGGRSRFVATHFRHLARERVVADLGAFQGIRN
jgi:hypothetical protein